MVYNPGYIYAETVVFSIAALLIIGWYASKDYHQKFKNRVRDKKKSNK